jgi:pyruvate dehydrogenase (quinone)
LNTSRLACVTAARSDRWAGRIQYWPPQLSSDDGAGIVAASAGTTARLALASNQSADSESSGGIVPQPSPQFAPDLTTADIMVETLISWGATHCFGVVGDGINSIIEALRKR